LSNFGALKKEYSLDFFCFVFGIYTELAEVSRQKMKRGFGVDDCSD